VVRNYTEVVGAIHEEGRLVGVRVQPAGGGAETELRGRTVVNASGPWFDRVAARLEPAAAPRLRTTKGIHLACSPFTTHAIFLESSVDGRAVFAIPWMGHTWVGTTDTDFDEDPGTAAATGRDVEYMVASLAPQLPAIRTATRHWTCAGVRALVRADGSASGVSRMHRIATGTPGLVSVLGGKLTGYRAIAEEVVDVVCQRLGRTERSSTADRVLPGGGRERSGVPHLDAIYGSRAARVQALAASRPELARPLGPGHPDIAAQVRYAAEHEWSRGPNDFLHRRSYLGFTAGRGEDVRGAVARWMDTAVEPAAATSDSRG